MKTLIFEGAGWAGADTSKATDVSNCRIRTRLRNNIGRVIYLEILCCHFENTKIMPAWMKGFNYGAIIDFCYYYDAWWDRNRCVSKELQPLTNVHFEYNKKNILKFVNEKLNCSFDNMEVVNEGLHVFSTEEPLCDCSNGDYEPYKDIEVNINRLDGIEPLFSKDWYASYKISYDSLMELPYMRKYLENRIESEREKIKNSKNCAYFRWNKNGIITDLEIHAGCCMSVGSEDVEKIIDLIIKDNTNIKMLTD